MTFRKNVIRCVSQIPSGKVTSYGHIATLTGKPQTARQVGQILSSLAPDSIIPWWRVIDSKGFISIKNSGISKEYQKHYLERENIKVSDELVVNLKKYQWHPD